MAQVKLTTKELIVISTLIENVAGLGKKESNVGLYIDFMYMPSSQCEQLANILQHISTALYGFTKADQELCDKLRDAAN